MSVSVSKAGPYFSSGSISFSSLRNTFKEVGSGTIRASELKRITSTSNTDPIVPDCTENRTSGPLSNGISTGNNLKLSQFRNSIKYYYITQSDTNTYFNINNQSWNSNLDKNIRKWMYINGTCGSNTTHLAAAQLESGVNIIIEVNGSILGAGGIGGVEGDVNGKPGGTALYCYGTSNVIIIVGGNGKIYGGGGGGEKGATGAAGPAGTCYTAFQQADGCGNARNDGFAYSYQVKTGTRCWWRFCCEEVCNDQYATVNVYNCAAAFAVPGAPGGQGGDGGRGEGYQFSRTGGLGGFLGTPGGCPTYGGTGYTGETGGDGGDWGSSGGNTTNTGNGGPAGRAISGSNYTLNGVINLNTVRGLYNP